MAFAPVSPLTIDGLPKFLSFAFHRTIEWAVVAFVNLNLADRLVHAVPDRGMTVEEIMGDDQAKWNKDLLYRLLRPCIDAGIVKKVNDDKHFILTESGMMLTTDHPSHASDLIKLFFGFEWSNVTDKLANIVRGEGANGFILTHDVDFYTFLSRPDQKHLLDTFIGGMTAFSEHTGDRLVFGVDFGRFETVVDFGGNRGTFLAQILHHYPSIKHGIIFDLSQVINQVNKGEDFESRNISKDRYTFIAGNMFDSSTIPQADCYILKHILHNYNDEKFIDILSSIRHANQNSNRQIVTIFIVEYIILEDGAICNWQTHGIDMAMGIFHGSAKERTQQEYQQLLEKADFSFKQLYPIQAPDSIIEAALNIR